MGSVNIDSFVNSLNNVYSQNLKGTDAEAKVQNVKFSVIDGNSVQLSYVDASGQAQVMKLPMPDLEKPKVQVTAENVQKCLAMISRITEDMGLGTELKGKVDAAFKNLLDSFAKKVNESQDKFANCKTVFDVLAVLMQLMVQCAQEQEKIAYESREADLQSELGAIYSAAKYAQSAAVAKLVTCVVGAVVQTAMAFGSFLSSSEAKAIKEENGVGTANNNYQNAHLEGDLGAAKGAMDKVAADLEIPQGMQDQVKKATQGVELPEGADVAAATKDVKANQELQGKKTELAQQKDEVAKNQQTLEQKKAELKGLEDKFNDKNNINNENNAPGLKEQIEAKNGEITEIGDKIKTGEAKVKSLTEEINAGEKPIADAKAEQKNLIKNADNKVAAKEQNLKEAEALGNEADIKTAREELLAAKAEAAGVKVAVAKNELTAAIESGDQKAINAARENYRNAVDEGVEVFSEDCDNFRAAYKLERDAPKPNAEKVEAMRKELIAKQNAFEYANSARTVAFSEQIGGVPVSTPEQIKGDIAARKMELNSASNMANADPKMDTVTDPRLKWDAAQRIVQALENAANAGFGIFESKAKAIEGNRVMAQQSAEADNQMLAQSRKLLEAILQMFQALQNGINNSRV